MVAALNQSLDRSNASRFLDDSAVYSPCSSVPYRSTRPYSASPSNRTIFTPPPYSGMKVRIQNSPMLTKDNYRNVICCGLPDDQTDLDQFLTDMTQKCGQWAKSVEPKIDFSVRIGRFQEEKVRPVKIRFCDSASRDIFLFFANEIVKCEWQFSGKVPYFRRDFLE